MPARERLSIVDLCASRVRLAPEDVSAIVRRVCLHTAALPVVPVERGPRPFGPEHVLLDRQGQVHLAPDVWPTVADLGALLEDLLAEVRRRGVSRMPPGLLIAAARATGKIDAAPLASTHALARALERFDPPDPDAALRRLFEAASAPTLTLVAPAPTLTLVAPPPAPASPIPARVAKRPRRAAVAILGTAAFAAGIAAALLLQPPEPVRHATDATEVTLATSGASDSPRAASEPRSVETEPREPDSRTPAAHVLAPRPTPHAVAGSRQPERGATAPQRARGVPPIASPVDRGVTSAVQPLVDPDDAGADGAFSPSFDSRGTAVFFHAQSGGSSALKRAERDGNGVLHVVSIVDDAAKNYHVQVSPDGRSVAFDSDRDGVRGVYVANADGTDVRRVSGPDYSAVPTWAPDGRRLAFLRAETDRPRVWNLWVRDLSSGEMTRVTNHAYGQVWSGAWFPDGRRLAYSHEDRLIVMDLGSRRSTIYPSPRKGQLVRTPAVSPDGRWIMFQVFRDGAWLLDLETGSMTRALDDPSAEEFTWTPDGRRVAFHSRRSGEWGLWVMAAR